MRILIAPDSYKGSVSARGVATAMARGIMRAAEDAVCVLLPIADGGEGTLRALCREENLRSALVRGPSGEPVRALWGGTGDTAVIEMAEAAGLTLVPKEGRRPLAFSTYGVGELIREALDAGYRRILLTVGGSGTNDGGSGMLEALGARFYDDRGVALPGRGETLGRIARIDLSGLDGRLSETAFTLACDVKNPLLGENGATYVYGPQKGIRAEELQAVDRAMAHFAALFAEASGKAIAEIPGCGAGGGIGLPLLALFDTGIRSGIDAVLSAAGFAEQLRGADLVLTGEGKIDGQSACGKAISGVAEAASAQGVPVFALAGSIGEGYEAIYQSGVSGVFTVLERPCTLDDAMQNAEALIECAAERAMRVFLALCR